MQTFDAQSNVVDLFGEGKGRMRLVEFGNDMEHVASVQSLWFT